MNAHIFRLVSSALYIHYLSLITTSLAASPLYVLHPLPFIVETKLLHRMFFKLALSSTFTPAEMVIIIIVCATIFLAVVVVTIGCVCLRW